VGDTVLTDAQVLSAEMFAARLAKVRFGPDAFFRQPSYTTIQEICLMSAFPKQEA